MLKKVAAALLLVGLALPYSCGTRPILGAWDDLPTIMMLGIPVLLAVAYALVALVPGFMRFQERYGREFHGVGRAVFLALWGAYLYAGLKGESDSPLVWLTPLVLTAALLLWQQQRGTKAERLQLLRLTIVGLPAVTYLASGLSSGGLQIGAWVATAGWVLGVVAEVETLQRAPKVVHTG
jgi:hypothetical protein